MVGTERFELSTYGLRENSGPFLQLRGDGVVNEIKDLRAPTLFILHHLAWPIGQNWTRMHFAAQVQFYRNRLMKCANFRSRG